MNEDKKNESKIKIDLEKSRNAVLKEINEIEDKPVLEKKDNSKSILSTSKQLNKTIDVTEKDSTSTNKDEINVKDKNILNDLLKDKPKITASKKIIAKTLPEIAVKIKHLVKDEESTHIIDKYIKTEKKREEKEEKKKSKKKINKKKINKKGKNINSKIKANKTSNFNFFIFLKNIIYKILFGLIILIFIFFIYIFLIIKFEIDTTITRKMNNLFPIPAIITKDGYISYYDYLDMVINHPRSFNELNILNQIIVLNLANKYQLELDDPTLLDSVKFNLTLDEEINSVGIQRINNIRKMIDEEGSFIKVSSKYGDERGRIDINKNDKNNFSFYNKIYQLKINEISEVISSIDGYYIFQCFDKTNDEIFLSYVFVKSTNLDDYINKTIKDYKIWSLIK